jgi:hypothetical protein
MGIFSTFSGRYSSYSNVKNGRTYVPISFWKRNQNVLGSFPNLSCWEQIVSIWSRICSLYQIEMCSFDGADSGTNSDVLVSFMLDVGTFVECLLNICSFTVLTLPNPQYPHSQNLTSAIIKFILTLLQYCTTKEILLLYFFIILMYIFLPHF